MTNSNVTAGLEAAERRNEFIEEITFQAEWREGKATEYPDDHRNRQSADSLRQLAQELGNIAPHDPLWARYHQVWEECSDDPAPLVEFEAEVRREYGFYGDASPVTMESAEKFLRSLVENLEQLAGVNQ